MLRNDEIDDHAADPLDYSPEPRKDTVTDRQIEEFLNRRFPPLVGTGSYQERQEMRAEMRQEIASRAAAHVELGSPRARAIALAIESLAVPPTVSSSQQLAARRASARSGIGASLRPALGAFGASAAGSLALLYLGGRTPGTFMALFVIVAIGLSPFLAGARLGSKQTHAPIRGLLLAHLLLYAPVLAGLQFVLAGLPDLGTCAVGVAVGAALSALAGTAGVRAGSWLQRSIPRWTRK